MLSIIVYRPGKSIQATDDLTMEPNLYDKNFDIRLKIM
ncbi:hypothetical protein SD78_3371 [Bacillus badius]|nr:hypothetical protein SD78_3371 [Bacillus badius]